MNNNTSLPLLLANQIIKYTKRNISVDRIAELIVENYNSVEIAEYLEVDSMKIYKVLAYELLGA